MLFLARFSSSFLFRLTASPKRQDFEFKIANAMICFVSCWFNPWLPRRRLPNVRYLSVGIGSIGRASLRIWRTQGVVNEANVVNEAKIRIFYIYS